MDIKRIDNYIDDRFSKEALLQHGAFLIDGKPYEVVIVSESKAIVYGEDKNNYEELIDEFRYYTPHIIEFRDRSNSMIKAYPNCTIICIDINSIQPSQFFVDKDKVEAVSTFIKDESDIIIQVIKKDDTYISLDGHTRLYYAYEKGYTKVKAVLEEDNNWVWDFVEEAQKRDIYKVSDMQLLEHEDYEEKWNRFCDRFFENKENK